MKIEMGESLIYSWLRHIKRCQIVQPNWKVSDKWNSSITDDLQNLMNEIQQRFNSPFGNVKTLQQLVKFSEVDVIGFDFDKKILYGVDVAFHSYGLRYSDNVQNVTKKILRTLLLLDLYFDANYIKVVIFSTPKINPNELNKLNKRMMEIQQFINEYKLNTQIEIYSNETFEDKILNPILHLSDDVADTSELFLRSYQLTQLFGKKTTKITTKEQSEKGNSNKEKIGKFVTKTFDRLFEEGKLSNDEIRNLMDLEYCKKTFGISSYPILTTSEIIDKEDIKRYYKREFGEKYLLCSQWIDKHYDKLNKWVLQIDK